MIIYYLGYMPPRGTRVTVPRSRVADISEQQRRAATICAHKFGIDYIIDESR